MENSKMAVSAWAMWFCWPLLAGGNLQAAHPISHTEIIMATASVALGALLGCLPFLSIIAPQEIN